MDTSFYLTLLKYREVFEFKASISLLESSLLNQTTLPLSYTLRATAHCPIQSVSILLRLVLVDYFFVNFFFIIYLFYIISNRDSCSYENIIPKYQLISQIKIMTYACASTSNKSTNKKLFQMKPQSTQDSFVRFSSFCNQTLMGLFLTCK